VRDAIPLRGTRLLVAPTKPLSKSNIDSILQIGLVPQNMTNFNKEHEHEKKILSRQGIRDDKTESIKPKDKGVFSVFVKHFISKYPMKFTVLTMSFVISLVFAVTVSAGTPLWSIVATSPTTINVPADQTALVSYSVTNKSARTQTLSMKPIPGVSQQTTENGYCTDPFVLAPGQSCSLVLFISGANIPDSGITAGPIVCMNNNQLACSQPDVSNILHITKIAPLNSGMNDLAGAAFGSYGGAALAIGLIVLSWWGWRNRQQKRETVLNVKKTG
jgi:hypothetical protein